VVHELEPKLIKVSLLLNKAEHKLHRVPRKFYEIRHNISFSYLYQHSLPFITCCPKPDNHCSRQMNEK